jgi:hypothetical protein
MSTLSAAPSRGLTLANSLETAFKKFAGFRPKSRLGPCDRVVLQAKL